MNYFSANCENQSIYSFAQEYKFIRSTSDAAICIGQNGSMFIYLFSKRKEIYLDILILNNSSIQDFTDCISNGNRILALISTSSHHYLVIIPLFSNSIQKINLKEKGFTLSFFDTNLVLIGLENGQILALDIPFTDKHDKTLNMCYECSLEDFISENKKQIETLSREINTVCILENKSPISVIHCISDTWIAFIGCKDGSLIIFDLKHHKIIHQSVDKKALCSSIVASNVHSNIVYVSAVRNSLESTSNCSITIYRVSLLEYDFNISLPFCKIIFEIFDFIEDSISVKVIHSFVIDSLIFGYIINVSTISSNDDFLMLFHVGIFESSNCNNIITCNVLKGSIHADQDLIFFSFRKFENYSCLCFIPKRIYSQIDSIPQNLRMQFGNDRTSVADLSIEGYVLSDNGIYEFSFPERITCFSRYVQIMEKTGLIRDNQIDDALSHYHYADFSNPLSTITKYLFYLKYYSTVKIILESASFSDTYIRQETILTISELIERLISTCIKSFKEGKSCDLSCRDILFFIVSLESHLKSKNIQLHASKNNQSILSKLFIINEIFRHFEIYNINVSSISDFDCSSRAFLHEIYNVILSKINASPTIENSSFLQSPAHLLSLVSIDGETILIKIFIAYVIKSFTVDSLNARSFFRNILRILEIDEHYIHILKCIWYSDRDNHEKAVKNYSKLQCRNVENKNVIELWLVLIKAIKCEFNSQKLILSVLQFIKQNPSCDLLFYQYIGRNAPNNLILSCLHDTLRGNSLRNLWISLYSADRIIPFIKFVYSYDRALFTRIYYEINESKPIISVIDKISANKLVSCPNPNEISLIHSINIFRSFYGNIKTSDISTYNSSIDVLNKISICSQKLDIDVSLFQYLYQLLEKDSDETGTIQYPKKRKFSDINNQMAQLEINKIRHNNVDVGDAMLNVLESTRIPEITLIEANETEISFNPVEDTVEQDVDGLIGYSISQSSNLSTNQKSNSPKRKKQRKTIPKTEPRKYYNLRARNKDVTSSSQHSLNTSTVVTESTYHSVMPSNDVTITNQKNPQTTVNRDQLIQDYIGGSDYIQLRSRKISSNTSSQVSKQSKFSSTKSVASKSKRLSQSKSRVNSRFIDYF